VPFGLIVRQPDLGTAALVGAGVLRHLFAGISWKVLATVADWACVRARLGFRTDYQRPPGSSRCSDPSTIRSRRLPQSPGLDHRGRLGRLLRQGLLNGTQAHLESSRSAHRFIFAVFSEEFGLIANLLLLILYSFPHARAR